MFWNYNIEDRAHMSEILTTKFTRIYNLQDNSKVANLDATESSAGSTWLDLLGDTDLGKLFSILCSPASHICLNFVCSTYRLEHITDRT